MDNPYVCDAYARIARVSAETKDPNTCRKYLIKAVGMYGLHISCDDDDTLDDLSWAHALNNMGNVFGELNKHSTALKYYLASERIRKANKDLYSLQCMQEFITSAGKSYPQ